MKIVVDLTRCQGYAQCAFAAPDVFAMRGDEALLYDPDPDDAEQAKIARAAAACPVQAIFVDREDARHRQAGTRAVPSTEEEFKRTGRIVIVGASLAALRAGWTLRQEGFAGSLTMIGDEPYLPYDRPPLSKQVLIGQVPARRTTLPRHDEVDANWRRGVAATGLDLSGKQILLADGEKVGFDRLLIATGCGPARGRTRRRPTSTGCSRCAPRTTRTSSGNGWQPAPAGCWSSVPGSPAPRSPPPAASWTCR
jgi:ferredoxin